MRRTAVLLFWATCVLAADDKVVFKSDVSMVRVDAQVLDRDNRPITGLRLEDFVLREEGRQQEIRAFSREEIPVDVLLLLDVSTSMKPHIQRISSAAHSAFAVLGKDDRIGIMVFDRSTRVRMALRSDVTGAERELDRTLKDERFNGGTDITRAMFDAASYMQRDGRKQARRAIVIVTDDQTEFDSDEEGVEKSLARGETVMSALIAPDAMSGRWNQGRGQRYPDDQYPDCRNYPNDPACRNGGSTDCRTYPNDPNCRNYPNGGGRSRGPLGGIILPGGGGGYPNGGGYPGGGGGGGRRSPGNGNGRPATHSAGTSEIARSSGGDSLRVDDTSGLETALSRLRQRYALFFYLPAGARAGQSREISVQLADAAVRRYPEADIRYRRSYMAPEGAAPANGPDAPTVVRDGQSTSNEVVPENGGLRRRRATSGEGRTNGPLTGTPLSDEPVAVKPSTGTPTNQPAENPAVKSPTWRRTDDPSTDTSGPKTVDPGDNSNRGGWRKVKPTDPPQP